MVSKWTHLCLKQAHFWILINKHFFNKSEFEKINIQNSEIQQHMAPCMLSSFPKGENIVPLANKNTKY